MTTPSRTSKPKGRRSKAPVVVEPGANGSDPGAGDASQAHFEFVKLQVGYVMGQMTLGDAKAGAMLAFIVALSGVTADRLKEVDPSPLSVVLVTAALVLSLGGLAWAAYVIWPRSIDKPAKDPEDDPMEERTVNLFSWLVLAKLAPRPAQPGLKGWIGGWIERALRLDPFRGERDSMIKRLSIAPTHGARLASAVQPQLVKDVAAMLEELALIVQRKYLGVRHGVAWVMMATLTHVAIWIVAGVGASPE